MAMTTTFHRRVCGELSASVDKVDVKRVAHTRTDDGVRNAGHARDTSIHEVFLYILSSLHQ